MSFDRTDRISEEIRRALDQIIRERVKDPRVSGTFSLVEVKATRDLRYAKVYVSVLEEEKREPLLKALKTAAGFIRHELKDAVMLRYTPELLFELDQSIEKGAEMSKMIDSLIKQERGDDHD